MIGDNETNFTSQLLLTNKQVANIRQAFVNNSSIDIKLLKTELSKMIQWGGFRGRLLGALLKTGFLLIKNVIKPLAESVLNPLGLIAASPAADAGIHKKILRSENPSSFDNNTVLIITNDEMEDIIKIGKSLEDSGFLLKGGTETVQNVKKQKGGFLSMLLGTLDANLLGNLLTGKGI